MKQQKKGFPSSIKTLWVKPIKIIPKPFVTDLVTLYFAPGFNKKSSCTRESNWFVTCGRMHVDTTQPINLPACLAHSPCFFSSSFVSRIFPFICDLRGEYLCCKINLVKLIRDSWGLLSFYDCRLISKYNVPYLIRFYKALFNLRSSSYHSHPQPIIADKTFQDRWPIIKVKEFFSGCMSLLRTLIGGTFSHTESFAKSGWNLSRNVLSLFIVVVSRCSRLRL